MTWTCSSRDTHFLSHQSYYQETEYWKLQFLPSFLPFSSGAQCICGMSYRPQACWGKWPLCIFAWLSHITWQTSILYGRLGFQRTISVPRSCFSLPRICSVRVQPSACFAPSNIQGSFSNNIPKSVLFLLEGVTLSAFEDLAESVVLVVMVLLLFLNGL